MKLKTLFLAALAVLAIASCDSKKKMILGVQLDPAEIYLTKEDNASSSFEVYASDSWTVKSTADWLNISQDKGKGDASLSVWAASANTGKPRKATVVFRCGYYHYATLTVTQQGELEASDGLSPEKAFSVQEARELVLDPTSDLSKKYFVKGKIHKISNTYTKNISYGNADFYISDDGNSSQEDFYCYHVLYLGNRKFKTGDTDINVKDDVIIYGKLTNYNGTIETEQNNGFLYDLNGVHEEVQTEFEEVTVAEFLDKKDENLAYDVVGKVTSISLASASSSYYGVNIAGGGKTLQCAFPSNWDDWKDRLAKNGTLKIRGKYSTYNGSPQMSNGEILSFEEGQIVVVEGSVSDVVSAEDGSEVTVSDAIVAALTTKGFVVTDGTNNCYVYQNATPSVKIGDKVSLKGNKTTYYGLPEVTEPKDIAVATSDNNVPRTELKDITSTVDTYDSDKADYITFTGTLAKDGNYYNISKSGATWKLSASQPTSALTTVLDGLNNSEVTITGYFNTKNTGKKLINIILTEAVAASGSYCHADKTAIEVPAETTSAKFNIIANAAWTLQAPDAVGFQSVNPASGNANAEVTATFEANTTSENRVFEILLTCADASVRQTITITQLAQGVSTGDTVTAAVAKATADGVDVTIGDAIIAAFTQKGFVITDGTTNCYVFTSSAPSSTLKLGDKVSLKGKMKIYYKLPEVTNPAEITVITSGNNIPRTAVVDITPNIDTYDATAADYITFTGALTKDGNYYNFRKDGAENRLSATYPSSDMTALLDGLLDNDVIVTGYYNTKNVNSKYLSIIVTDVQAADPDAKYCRVTEGNSISVAATATSTTLHVKANAAWSITAGSGASVSPANGNADAAVTVSFAANTATSAKTYTLTLVCTDASVNQTITITQAAASSGSGGTVEFTPSNAGGMSGSSTALSGKLEEVNVSISSGTIAEDSIRIFKKQTITFSVSSGMKITQIVFTCTANNTSQYGPGCFTAQEGYSYDGKIGTWTGSSDTVSFTAETNQVRATSIKVTYTK
ncbi:MAG: hypothetical protein IKP46_09200 [Bacteroidales bacterium]|nr:hypothetical protein [Bacteroidales bacterium]